MAIIAPHHQDDVRPVRSSSNKSASAVAADVFTAYKFRTMRFGADEEKENFLHLNEAIGTAVQNSKRPTDDADRQMAPPHEY